MRRGALFARAAGAIGAEPMSAIYVILVFVAVIALINRLEYGRLD